MIKDEDVLSLEEFMKEFKIRLKNDDIDNNVHENMIATLLEIEEFKRETYKNKIKDIYISILSVKKVDCPKCDIGSISLLISSIVYLKNDISFYYDIDNYWDKNKLCEEAYKELIEDPIYSKYLDNNIDDEYKLEHLFDIKYHLDNFRKYSDNKEFLEVLDKELWRYV